jgi:hypothetical protein
MSTAVRSVSAFVASAVAADCLFLRSVAEAHALAPPKSQAAMAAELCLPDMQPLYISARGVVRTAATGWFAGPAASDYELGVFSPIGSAPDVTRDLNGALPSWLRTVEVETMGMR